MMDQLQGYNENTFEGIKRITDEGVEYWFARDLQMVLEYKEWRNFETVINKAKIACEASGNNASDYFVDANKIVLTGISEKEISDIQLSRYACYLIVQNGDPRKSVIALGQTYFAVKTRQAELIENYEDLSEEQKRLSIRNEIKKHNLSLAEAAGNAGIIRPLDDAVFQNKGYQGLYGGLGAKEIHSKKGLKGSEQILDYMGSTELVANLFRATQTDEKLRRDHIVGKDEANNTHYDVGLKVRKTIEELGGIMPEDLPTPTKSTKKIEKEEKERAKTIEN